MKIGQTFGIGKGTIELYCEVTGVDGPDINFYVINGAWDGTLKPKNTMIVHAPRGDESHQVDTYYLWHIPSMDYGEAIAYMNDHLKKPKVYLFAQDLVFKFMLRYNRFISACSAAKTAFMKSWKRGHVTKSGFEDMDDDIAF